MAEQAQPRGMGSRMAITLRVDGSDIEVPPGATVLDAVNRLGVALPQLCKDPDRPPPRPRGAPAPTARSHGGGRPASPAACHLPAREGMVVQTQHEGAARLRKAVLDLTLSMLTPSSDRNGFDQVGVAAARPGPQRPP